MLVKSSRPGGFFFFLIYVWVDGWNLYTQCRAWTYRPEDQELRAPQTEPGRHSRNFFFWGKVFHYGFHFYNSLWLLGFLSFYPFCKLYFFICLFHQNFQILFLISSYCLRNVCIKKISPTGDWRKEEPEVKVFMPGSLPFSFLTLVT